jgi:hypothetical protein
VLTFTAPELTIMAADLDSRALAASVFLSAWEYKQPGLLCGLSTGAGALVHAVVFATRRLSIPWTVAFLHATLAVAARAARGAARGETAEPPASAEG